MIKKQIQQMKKLRNTIQQKPGNARTEIYQDIIKDVPPSSREPKCKQPDSFSAAPKDPALEALQCPPLT